MSKQETEQIVIDCTWRASVRVEVPTGWRPGGTLNDWPDEVLDQVDTTDAELVDWSTRDSAGATDG